MTFRALAEEAERLVLSDLAHALEATDLLVAAADLLGDPRVRARVRRARAQALAYANRFDEALDRIAEAAYLADAGGDAIEVARANLTSIHPLARLGRLDEAIRAGEAARRGFIQAGAPKLGARAEVNLGVAHRLRDDPRAALAHFDRAATLLEDEPLVLAQVQSNRAEALLDLDEFEQAEAAFRAALGLFLRQNHHRAVPIIEGNLADLMSRQGRLDEALELFERALRRLADGSAPGDGARLEAERAEVLLESGLAAEAVEAYQRALPVLVACGLAWEAARGRAGLGRALLALGRMADAASELSAAADESRRLGRDAAAARADSLRAELAAAAGQPSLALQLARLAAWGLSGRPVDEGAARLRLARLLLDQGKAKEAASEIRAAAEVARRLDLAPLLAESLHVRAGINAALGDHAAARSDLREALAQIERTRGTLRAEAMRAALVGRRRQIFEDAFWAELDAGGPGAAPAAFEVAERARGRALSDMLHGGAALANTTPDSADPDEAALLDELSRRRAELNALYWRLDEARRGPDSHWDEHEWQRRVRHCERSIAMLELRLAATSRLASVFAPTPSLEEVQTLLGDATLVEYFIDSGHVSAIVATRADAGAYRRFATLRDVQDRADRLSFQVARAIARGLDAFSSPRLIADARRELASLGHLLLAPLAPSLERAPHVCFVPHGSLHGLPFAALGWHERSLIEHAGVTTLPSAAVLRDLWHRSCAPTGRRAVVVGLADDLAPGAEREAAAVAAALSDSVLLTGPGARTDRLRTATPSASLLHIASHARFSPQAPMASGIRLADGWLTARDVCSLRLPASAVVLNACESGRGLVGAGDEQLGLVRGFLIAGASCLVVGLWPMHDRIARELVAAMYSRWYSESHMELRRLGAALRYAQLKVMREWPHPAAWAAFTCVGAS